MDFTLEFTRIFFTELYYVGPLLLTLAILIVILGLLVGRREGWPRLDAIYYAFITATTVGYGDFRPRKRSSKCLAIAIALTGVLLTGLIVAVALHAATDAFRHTFDLEQIQKVIDR